MVVSGNTSHKANERCIATFAASLYERRSSARTAEMDFAA
jgi:hypothetical protein